MLQVALGWTNSHLHVFEIADQRIAIPYDLEQLMDGQITCSARLVTLGDVVDHAVRRFAYEYDFGDSWRVLAAALSPVPSKCVATAMRATHLSEPLPFVRFWPSYRYTFHCSAWGC